MTQIVYRSYTPDGHGTVCSFDGEHSQARNYRHSKDLHTDGVGFEPTVRYKRTHTFQARLLSATNKHRRSTTVVTYAHQRSLRSEASPKQATSRIQNVYSAPSNSRGRS